MNCPKCGVEVVPQQKFCRACGTTLTMDTQRLTEPATVSQPQSHTEIAPRDNLHRPEKLLAWGLIVMFVGAAIGIIGKMLIHVDVVTVAGVLVALAGMFLSVFPYVFPSPRRRRISNESSESELQAQPKSQKSLPEERPIEHVPSITERTTDLLTNSVATPNRATSRESQE